MRKIADDKTPTIGRRFGRLVVTSKAPRADHRTRWECRCDCGGVRVVRGDNLRDGSTRSCGCAVREQVLKLVATKPNLSHGYTSGGRTRPEYRAWQAAKRRCGDSRLRNFHHYGGRGIVMCEEWVNSFDAFIAHVGPKPDGGRRISIDRIDNNRGYEPGNVRWATASEQGRNRRTWKRKKAIHDPAGN